MDSICDDLAAEHEVLDAMVAALAHDRWDDPTPASGWSIRDQISHLWFFDRRAELALRDADAFAADARALLAAGGVDASVLPGRELTPAELLHRWRSDRRALLDHARTVDPSRRVPWYGPPMGARSCITARLMETWAHGYDVADAIGVAMPATGRLRHVAHIGVRARAFSYAVHGRAAPTDDVFVVLRDPAGVEVTYGTPDARSSIHANMLDFCLLVTQRRHRDDLDLVVVGDDAETWVTIAQAFAGPPGPGRQPESFTGR